MHLPQSLCSGLGEFRRSLLAAGSSEQLQKETAFMNISTQRQQAHKAYESSSSPSVAIQRFHGSHRSFVSTQRYSGMTVVGAMIHHLRVFKNKFLALMHFSQSPSAAAGYSTAFQSGLLIGSQLQNKIIFAFTHKLTK